MGRFTVGVKLCLLDGNGGVRVAGASRLHKTYKMMTVFALMGYAAASHDIPRGFAVPQFGLARAKSYRRGNAMADLPQG